MPKYLIQLFKTSPKLAKKLYYQWKRYTQPLGKEFTQGYREALKVKPSVKNGNAFW